MANQQPTTSSHEMVKASPKASHAHQCATEMVKISPNGCSHTQQLLKGQPAHVFRNELFIDRHEWNKLAAQLKELQNRMAAKTIELAKGEVFIVMGELNLLAANMEEPTDALAAEINELMQLIAKTEELMQIMQQHIDQCDEVRKICATRGKDLTGVKEVESLSCEVKNASEDSYRVIENKKNTSHFRKVHPIGFPVGNQGMTMVYQIPKTCMCSTENQYLSQNAYVSIPRFSYNYSVSNVLQNDQIPIIYL
jgi:hypothetical protein